MTTVLVTGAAGFIGSVVCAELRDDFDIIGIDSLMGACARRYGPPEGIEFYAADARSIESLPLPRIDTVIHLAAQVAVTRSITSPTNDFECNAELGFRIARFAQERRCQLIYASTNKVFGSLGCVDTPIGDDEPIDPRTPYGISKAVGDLYARELVPEHYVLRQSCIVGPAQVGSEDQGWVQHVARCGRDGVPLTCYGDGAQVRDLLHVLDLVALYRRCIDRAVVPGVYTVGGGESRAITFSDAATAFGAKIEKYRSWRPFDQRYFVSANRSLTEQGWEPKRSLDDILAAMR